MPANAGDTGDSGSIPGSGRSPGGGHGNPLQYSGPENLMDKGMWWATVRGVTKRRTWLKRLSTHPQAVTRKNSPLVNMIQVKSSSVSLLM